MLKALFLDMDETLCDTKKANAEAQQLLGEAAQQAYGAEHDGFDGQIFSAAYVKGIYREWSEAQRARYMPIIEQRSEGAYRVQLIRDLLAEQGISDVPEEDAQALQDKFDHDRITAFNFYPGIMEFLTEARQLLTLVVITNGPEYSQIPKVEAIKLAEHVDHIIIGGQEPEQKPARSIFEKALKLANCEAHEAIHVGDSLAADIAGAHNSHITSVWIQHQQPLDAELGIEPSHTVMHPDEIPELIWQLHGQ
ncbi:HAD family hydrolase [Aestuariicella hydrocarbonica]|uniref:HAD family hydrolase n=1 Tax=Pseudomaricurvus hydrocarbonicus TaxID=1470433 RepID=A0A9E5MLT2_9GAMM|nr:HAD family hydrolase [Aestuariicella hydrocarbonica]NHO64580.1 HAD family hydrolase [Aestuariicella hydrocarbonica]